MTNCSDNFNISFASGIWFILIWICKQCKVKYTRGIKFLVFFPSKVRVGSWSRLTDVSGTLQYIYSFSYTQVSVTHTDLQTITKKKIMHMMCTASLLFYV